MTYTGIDLRVYDKNRWILLKEITAEIIPGVLTVTVPAGFVTDLASVPRIFWNIISPHGDHIRAAIIHDYMYANQWPKDISDSCFLIVMQRDKVNMFKRMLMHRAVKRFGDPSNSELIIVEV
jgi:hypothetical protein